MPTLSAHPATSATQDNLVLMNKSGQQVTLTKSTLERWFANVEAKKPLSKDTDSTSLATQFVSRFGLQNAQDVITFLRSPAGKSTEEMIGAQLAELAAMLDERNFQWREQEALRHRIMAFLLLGLLYNRKANAQDLNERIQQQIDKTLSREAEKNASAPSLNTVDYQRAYNETLNAYSQSITAIESQLQDKLTASEVLEKAIDTAEKQGEQIKAKYTQLNSALEKMEQFFNLDSLPELTTTVDIANHPVAIAIIDRMEQEIKDLTRQIYLDKDEIVALLDSDDPMAEEAAYKLRDETNERNLRIGALINYISVLKGDSIACDADGNPVKSLAEAALILAKEKKVVKDNDKYYLLNANQDFDDLSEDERTRAEQAYLRLKPEMMSVKKLIQHNEELEYGDNKEKRSALSSSNEIMQQQILLLANQMTQIQAARAQATAILNTIVVASTAHMSPLPTATPTPKPTSSAPAALATANMSSVTSSYRHVLRLMQNNPSEQGLARLKESMSLFKGQSPDMQNAVNTVNTLKAGTPIPYQTMQSLLANIERFGVSASKPNVAASIDPAPRLADTFHPTPFSMKPPGHH